MSAPAMMRRSEQGPARGSKPGEATAPSLLPFFGAVALVGIVNTFLGPTLPSLTARWTLLDSQAGLLFAAQFFGSMAGSLLSGWMAARHGFSGVALLGFAAMSVGCGALPAAGWPLALVAVFFAGFGVGLIVPSANVFAAQSCSANPASGVGLVNLAWGIGAISFPPLVSLFSRTGNVPALLLLVAAACALTMFALARWCRMNFPAAAGGHRETAVARTGLLRHQLFQMAFFCALFFLYTGTEASLGGWLAMLAQRLGSLPSELHAMAPTFFWGALVGGRGLTVIALHRIPERYLSLMGLASAVVGVSMLTVAGSYSQIVTGALIAGLGLAPVFPLFVTHLTRHFGDAAGRAAAVGFAFSGVGPALLPWLVGATSAQFGSLKAGLGVPLCSALLLLALDPFRTRGERR